MNTRLELFFEKYNLSEKDRYEINQIFGLLPPGKQQNILKNFPVLASKLEQIQKEIELERRILIGDLFNDIKEFYNKYSIEVGNL